MTSRLGIMLALLLAGGMAAKADARWQGEASWMRGTWTGTGHKEKTRTSWSIRLVVTPAANAPFGQSFAIQYPSLSCGGHWTLNQADFGAGVATFTEHITYGNDRCVDDGTVTVERVSAREMRYRWSGSGDRASADLLRE